MNMRKLYNKLAEICDAGHRYFTDKAAADLFREMRSTRRTKACAVDAKLPVDAGGTGQMRLALKNEETKNALIRGYVRGRAALSKKSVPSTPEDVELEFGRPGANEPVALKEWKGANWNQGNGSHEGDD